MLYARACHARSLEVEGNSLSEGEEEGRKEAAAVVFNRFAAAADPMRSRARIRPANLCPWFANEVSLRPHCKWQSRHLRVEEG